MKFLAYLTWMFPLILLQNALFPCRHSRWILSIEDAREKKWKMSIDVGSSFLDYCYAFPLNIFIRISSYPRLFFALSTPKPVAIYESCVYVHCQFLLFFDRSTYRCDLSIMLCVRWTMIDCWTALRYDDRLYMWALWNDANAYWYVRCILKTGLIYYSLFHIYKLHFKRSSRLREPQFVILQKIHVTHSNSSSSCLSLLRV